MLLVEPVVEPLVEPEAPPPSIVNKLPMKPCPGSLGLGERCPLLSPEPDGGPGPGAWCEGCGTSWYLREAVFSTSAWNLGSMLLTCRQDMFRWISTTA